MGFIGTPLLQYAHPCLSQRVLLLYTLDNLPVDKISLCSSDRPVTITKHMLGSLNTNIVKVCDHQRQLGIHYSQILTGHSYTTLAILAPRLRPHVSTCTQRTNICSNMSISTLSDTDKLWFISKNRSFFKPGSALRADIDVPSAINRHFPQI